ncbi:hypothetical protein P7C71_g5375, partial [Lecanoromycetidae sp. Uapishka_2]
MDELPETASPNYLRNRITVAKGQLADLDVNEEEYSVRKMVLEHGLASLEEQLLDAERAESHRQHEENMKWIDDSVGTTAPDVQHQRSHSSCATHKSSSDFSSSAGSSHNAFGGNVASDRFMARQGQAGVHPSTWYYNSSGGPTAAVTTVTTTPDTPNFPLVDGRSASGSISSPDSGFLRPQKRQRESVGLSNEAHAAKSMRTTPSPAVTGVTTPTSLDSFDFGDPELARLLGSDPNEDIRGMRESQKAFEKLQEERRMQERLDEEFARSLAAQEDDFSPSGSYLNAGPSTAPLSTSQTMLDSNGRFRRPERPSSSPLTIREDPFPMPSLPIKQENGYRKDTGHNPIKKERSHQTLPTRIPSSDFIVLDSDDEFEPVNGVAGHPSSDIVEIEPSAFLNNGLYGHGHNSVPGAYDAYDGNEGSSSSASWGLAAGQFGRSLSSAASGAYNSAINLIDQQIAGYGNTPMGYGGSSVYGNNSYSNGYSNFVDLADDDSSPVDYTHDVFDRHGINPEDPANRALLESYRSRIDYVTHDPTRTAAEIKSLLENIRPDEDLPPENREGTPEAMKYNLMEHQKLGLAWMKQMEEGSNKGGILADDMGLGKTIQALALIVTRKSTDPLRKTTLIVCPVGLLRQWEREIHKKLKPEHQLKVHILHGSQRDVLWEKLRKFDVVLTTFGTLGTEHKRKEDIEKKKRANPNWRPSGKADYLPLLGDESKWFRVIIDEAQCIKNKATKAALGAFHLQALTRFCMTGIIDTMAFKKVYLPEKVADELLDVDSEADVETTDDSDSDTETEDEDEDDDVDVKGNLKHFIVDDEIVEDASENEDENDEGYNSGKHPFEKSSSKKVKKKPNKGKGKAKADKPPRLTLAQLQKEGRKNLKARKRYLKRLEKEWETSAKIVQTMDILQGLRERRDPKTKEVEKTIIFSQFTSLLDLLEVPINREGYRYRRYDGSMTSKVRNEAVLEFTDKEDCTILLVSLKAGNAGLNLTAASQVIILDPFWNPYVEEQAIDRAHRIGQQKPVQVHRILVPNTVEDRILALQEKKRELIDTALDEKASKAVSRLGVQELGFLFDMPT